MGKKSQVLADTDILIKIYRGDSEKRKQLLPIQEYLSVSLITVMELYNGIQDRKRRYELSKTIKAYEVINLSASIGTTALSLLKKYLSKNLSVPDALIAATAIDQKVKLFTDNLKHFSFIKELELYKP